MKDRGQGQNARSQASVTTGKPSQSLPSQRTDGEVPGSGSVYSAQLIERENKAATRNKGPSRGTGGAVGDKDLPMLTSATRKTGRVG